MASQGKFNGRATDVTAVTLIDTSNSITCILDDEATDPWYAVAPFDGRVDQLSLYYSEAVDGTPTLTVTNATTSQAVTVTLAAASIDTAAIADLSDDLVVSAGDIVSVTTDGNGTTGQAVVHVLFRAEP